MADYSTSRWDATMYTLGERMKQPEFKRKPSPTLMKMLKYRDMLVSTGDRNSAMKEKKSDQSTIEIKLLNKQAITVGSARAYDHSGNKNDSRNKAVTFTTVTADYATSIKESDRIIWSDIELEAAQLHSAMIAIHNSIETTQLAGLNTNKSQVVVSATPTSGTWDATNHIFQVLNGDYDLFLQKLKGFMRENYYDGGVYETIFNEALYQKAETILAQGAGNNTNLAWQGMGIDALVSQELANDSGYLGMGYAFTPGTLGILDWIPEKNRTGFGDTFQIGGLYTRMPDPFGSGLTFAVHKRAVAADNDSTSGETQDINIHTEISIDLAPIIATTSTANESSIYKFGILT